MSNNPHFSITSKTASYNNALQATTDIESPSLGFAKPSEYQGSAQGFGAIIKQNNTQIQLLIHISEILEAIKNELHSLNKSKSPAVPEALITKLQNLAKQ